MEFMEAYFSWLEETGNAQEVLTDFSNYRDIDKTVEDFLEYFRKNYFENIPKNVIVDKRLLAKHVKDLYVSKGASPAYKLLFRILFNQNVEIFYPGDDVLRASDGRWVEDRVIRTTSTISGANIDYIDSSTVVGRTSGATAIVESKLRTQYSTVGMVLQKFIDGYTPPSFFRNSSATRTNSDGFLETVGNDVARIDYDGFTGENLGLLIEPSRQNHVINSNDFSNLSSWIHRRIVVFSNIHASPFGTMTADKIGDTNQLNTHYISQIFPSTNEQTYSYSVYIKADERDMVQLKFTNAHFGDFAFATFDLTSGTIFEQGTSLLRAKIKACKNGYYRCTITATADTTFLLSQVFVYLYDRTNGISFTGVGGEGVYLSCAQLESHASNSAETSYIPTEDVAALRESEYGYYDNIGDLLSTGSASIYVDVSRNVGDTVNSIFVQLSDLTNDFISFETVNNIVTLKNTSNGVLSTLSLNGPDVPVMPSRLVMGYRTKSQDNSLTANGIGVFSENTNANIAVGTKRIIFGSSTLNGHIRYIAIYPEFNSDVEVTTRTALTYNIMDLVPPVITEIYLSNINGEFIPGETVEFTNMLNSSSLSLSESVYEIYKGFNIVVSGTGYQVNDEIRIVEDLTGATIAVGNVSNIGPNGQIRTIAMNNFGITLLTDKTITIATENGSGAVLEPITGTLGEFAGRWIGTYGQLSSDKRLQDNLYYQDYSYVLRSSVDVDTFSDIVKELIHPAGFQLFGELFSEEINVNVIEISNLSLSVFRIIERLKSIIVSLSLPEESIERTFIRVMEEEFMSIETMDNVLLSQRMNATLSEYENINLYANLHDINEALTPDLSVYGVGILTARPAIFFDRKVSAIQTIQ